jgi:gamma-glutamyltranspeptidase
VSSAHPVATNAGLEILRAGGNVVDAAVAVSFALGVVEPDASGVGGYGQMVISLSGIEKPILIDFMTRVPEDAPLSNTTLLQNGRYPSDGPVLTNVPGTVAGMYAVFKKYGSGKIPWKDLVAPAIRAARDGYEVSEGLATTLSTEREHFLKYEGSRALFFPGGKPRVAGDTIKNADLAWVLDKIAQSGADGFYRGEVASKWVADLRAKGNAMKLSDLARYYAPEREPVIGTYRGYTLYSSAPPVSGGAELAGRLNLLEQFEKPRLYTEDAATMHAAVSAWLLVPSSRNRIADPGLWAVDVAPIVSKDTARLRWKCFDPAKALTPAAFRGDSLACAADSRESRVEPRAPKETPVEHRGSDQLSLDSRHSTLDCPYDHATEVSSCPAQGTTAFTIADNEGNAVAVTQTLGTWGGNFYVTPGLGFLSNDKLTSYGTDPTQYGSRLPFARHGSTLAPTIVMKGRKPVFAVGAAGNNWITSAVFQTIIGALDYGLGPQQALELPRFIPGGSGGGRGGGAAGAPAPPAKYTIQMEDGFSPEVTRRLRELGYDLSFISMRGELREGYGAAVSIDGKRVTAGADPRRAGSAGAVP